VNPGNQVEVVEQWFKRVEAAGQPVKMKIYKDAAHEFFTAGPVRGSQIKNGNQVGYSTGATPRALEEFLDDVAEVAKRSHGGDGPR
jgi:dienelactone hydrolase